MHQRTRRCVGYLLGTVMLVQTSPVLAAAAATVEFVWGTAHAVSLSGEYRKLEKGSPIEVGDKVVSGTARMQLRFSDGGFVSLAPHSEFRVNAYSYSGTPDGTEHVAMELMKGGLRTVSGLIGKAKKSAYEMKTNVATIGIRGTEYTVVYGESVSGTVSAGAIAVCNSGGCLDVAAGQSYHVSHENTKPVFISTPAFLSPRQPGEHQHDNMARRETHDARSAKGMQNLSDPNEKFSDWSGWKGKSDRGNKNVLNADGTNDSSFSIDSKDKSLSKINRGNMQSRDQNRSSQSVADNALSTFPLEDISNENLRGGHDVKKSKQN